MKNKYRAVLASGVALVIALGTFNSFAITDDKPDTETVSLKSVPTVSTVFPVNLNTVDATGLEEVKGIGPAKAQAIIDYRNQYGLFTSIDDLIKVKGISPTFIEKIKEMVTVK